MNLVIDNLFSKKLRDKKNKHSSTDYSYKAQSSIATSSRSTNNNSLSSKAKSSKSPVMKAKENEHLKEASKKNQTLETLEIGSEKRSERSSKSLKFERMPFTEKHHQIHAGKSDGRINDGIERASKRRALDRDSWESVEERNLRQQVVPAEEFAMDECKDSTASTAAAVNSNDSEETSDAFKKNESTKSNRRGSSVKRRSGSKRKRSKVNPSVFHFPSYEQSSHRTTRNFFKFYQIILLWYTYKITFDHLLGSGSNVSKE